MDGRPGGLAGRTVLVTGGSSGIGLEIVQQLAANGASVILPVRDRGRGAAAVAAIRERCPAAVLEPAELDLARLDSVDRLLDRLAGRRLDGVVLNAGIMLLGDRRRSRTVDGHELHFQTNFLGHAALLLGLRPWLAVAPGASPSRVVVQCSLAAAGARHGWEDLPTRRRGGALRAYRISKVALGAFALEFGRRTAAEGIRVDLCHPGIVPATAIAPAIRSRLPAGLVDWVVARLGNPPSMAARTALLALTTDAPAPVMAVPSAPGGWRGAPRLRGPYRRLADPALGAEVWARTLAALAGRR